MMDIFFWWSIYCRDFKEKEYHVTIPYAGPVDTSPAAQINNNNGGFGGNYGKQQQNVDQMYYNYYQDINNQQRRN
jgi:hypothetical protein